MLDDRPLNSLSGADVLALLDMLRFVRAWNASLPEVDWNSLPTRGKKKDAGVPSWQLERRRGYVT